MTSKIKKQLEKLQGLCEAEGYSFVYSVEKIEETPVKSPYNFFDDSPEDVKKFYEKSNNKEELIVKSKEYFLLYGKKHYQEILSSRTKLLHAWMTFFGKWFPEEREIALILKDQYEMNSGEYNQNTIIYK